MPPAVLVAVAIPVSISVSVLVSVYDRPRSNGPASHNPAFVIEAMAVRVRIKAIRRVVGIAKPAIFAGMMGISEGDSRHTECRRSQWFIRLGWLWRTSPRPRSEQFAQAGKKTAFRLHRPAFQNKAGCGHHTSENKEKTPIHHVQNRTLWVCPALHHSRFNTC
jgi:hypothetical protein